MRKEISLIIGAIAGDAIGSLFEFNNHKSTEFDLFTENTNFTDDSVMTAAIADSILNNLPIAETLKSYGRKYPHRGYGGMFRRWLKSEDSAPYNSFGNGSAMRVSPVGFAFNSENEVLTYAKMTAEVTHNHPEGIKGAQATAMAVYLAKNRKDKAHIKDYIEAKFGYNLSERLDEIRPDYEFDESCQGTVPQAIIAFLESKDYEDAVRLAISIGGDSDTLACITGGIAAAYYKEIPEYILEKTVELLPEKFIKLLIAFKQKYGY